jgi:hydrogenase maturation protease
MIINIVGLGCDVLGDLGVGIHAVDYLSKKSLGHNVNTIRAGNAILDHLEHFFNADLLLIIDAIIINNNPGKIHRFKISREEKSKIINTKHGFDLSTLIKFSEIKQYPEIIIYGIEPEYTSWSVDISENINKSLKCLFDMIRSDISQSNKTKNK